MFLTLEILERYNACEKGKEWFTHFFPNGGELMDVIQHRFVHPETLHWGFANLITTQEEREAYYKKLAIISFKKSFTRKRTAVKNWHPQCKVP